MNPSDLIVGALMTAFALLGLLLAARAVDDEMYVFGLSLLGFGTAFVFGLIKAYWDRQEREARHG